MVADAAPATVHFTVRDRQILVQAPTALFGRMDHVPRGYLFPPTQEWQYPAEPALAVALRRAFDGCRRLADPGFVALLEQAKRLDASEQVRAADDLPDIPNMKSSAWRHQRAAYAFVMAIWGLDVASR